MSSFNILFSKLEKFTGDGDINLQQWLRNFDRCCVIAEKSDDLVVGQILMLCVDGRAKAILDQFEDEKGSPQKYSELKEQLAVVFDSETDREAHMTAFERCIQKIDESEEELMTHLLQLFRAANPKAKTDIINHAVKRKFLQGNSDTLRRNIFIFCTNPYDDKISHQDLLKACRDASVNLSLPSATINGAVVTGPSDAVLTAAIHLIQHWTPFLPCPPNLSNKVNSQCGSLMNNKTKSMRSTVNFRFGPHSNFNISMVPLLFLPRRATVGNLRGNGFQRNFGRDFQPRNARPDGRQPIQCYFCHGLNHIQRDCLAYKQQANLPQQSGNFWGPQ